MLLMRRVFDACPEIDVIHAELWHANGRPMMFEQMTDGVKNILAGVLRRGPKLPRTSPCTPWRWRPKAPGAGPGAAGPRLS
ncbi:hypothetical protein ACFQ0M_07860 [Kitasatospora aburaviensis]